MILSTLCAVEGFRSMQTIRSCVYLAAQYSAPLFTPAQAHKTTLLNLYFLPEVWSDYFQLYFIYFSVAFTDILFY